MVNTDDASEGMTTKATALGETIRQGRHRLGILPKMMVAPLLMGAVFVGVGAIAVSALQTVNRDIDVISDELAPNSAVTTEIITTLAEERLRVQQYVLRRADSSRIAFREHAATLDERLQSVRSQVRQPGLREALTSFAEKHAQYTQLFEDELVPAIGRVNEARSALREEGTAVASALETIQKQADELNFSDLAYGAVSTDQSVQRMLMQTERYLVEPAAETAEAIHGAATRATEQLQDIRSWYGENENLDNAEASIERFRKHVDELVAAMSAMQSATADMDALGPQMADAASELDQKTMTALESLASASTDRAGRAVTLTATLTGGALVVGLVLVWLVTRLVARPLLSARRDVVSLLTDIREGHGDLSTRLRSTSHDEVGELVDAINGFIAALEEMVSGIAGETHRLASAAEELSSVTATTRDGVSRQRHEIDQIGSAMEQMTATAQEISRQISESATAADTCNGSATEGRQVVNATVETINGLADEVDQGAQTVLQLSGDVDTITRVLDVIREVAEQTNLLALNAAIEAARAGDTGRGFAVVADEVRALAGRTQSSTAEIQGIIERLQDGARRAAEQMDRARGTARSTVDEAGQAGDALTEIAQSVNRIAEMTTQVASAAEEQSTTSDTISANVSNVNGVVEESVSAVEQISDSSDELAAMAERLRGLVDCFTATQGVDGVGDGRAGDPPGSTPGTGKSPDRPVDQRRGDT